MLRNSLKFRTPRDNFVVNSLNEDSILEKAERLCLKNAKQYINDADILYSVKSYGHALALTVLSDVELGKAVIYNLWRKGLLSEETLTKPYQSSFLERQYGLLASDTWWVGLVIASNVDELVQNLLDASEKGVGASAVKGGELSAQANQRITELVEIMGRENKKLKELEEYRTKGFFVDFSLKEAKISTPAFVERTLVKEQLQKARKRIKRGEPFLSLPLNEALRRIAQLMLKEAFKSILPLRSRISQFILPVKNQFEESH